MKPFSTCVSLEKYWILKTSRNNLAESTLREFFVKANIFKLFHRIFPLPHFSSENANFGPFVILEMFWFAAQTWCQKQRRPKLEPNSQFPTISTISSILLLSISALMFLKNEMPPFRSLDPEGPQTSAFKYVLKTASQLNTYNWNVKRWNQKRPLWQLP